jgi:1,2-dihydroxy-3-keto-5-methylthiopentene dioxygenase
MARVQIPDENRWIDDPAEITQLLSGIGIRYEQWSGIDSLPADATDQQILETFAAEVQQLKDECGFVTADVINVHPDTPGLEQMLSKFNQEHTHSEDEVRFTVDGQGVFHIHPEQGPVVAIHVQRGDLISVPKGTKHWFNLCDDRRIRCIRLFEDMSGWTPHYIDAPVHGRFQPLCFGQAYVSSSPPESNFQTPDLP